MVFARLLLRFQITSFLALGSPVLDLLIRSLRRSISEIWDLQLTNQIALFVTFAYSDVIHLLMLIMHTHYCQDIQDSPKASCTQN